MHDAGLLVLTSLLPMAVGVLAFLLPSSARVLALPGWLLTTASIAVPAARYSGPLHYVLGAWPASLGITLAADGLTLAFMLMAAAVFGAVLAYAAAYYAADSGEARYFPPLAWLLWSALNAVFMAGDLFNLFVALELLGLCAVGLAALNGRGAALAASLRYLLAILGASNLFLLAVTLLYASTGVLTLEGIATRLAAGPAAALAGALLLVSLALKTALLPLHFWLPPAHAGATTPVSALLSALVIKASFLALLRLVQVLGPAVNVTAAGSLLAVLGAIAVLWGSAAALAQDRLKMMVAYSTVAQVGYLFIALGWVAQGSPAAAMAVQAAVLHTIAHGLAKAAMFLSAGSLIRAAGRDDLAAARGAAATQPLLIFAFGLAAMSLVGLPPSMGFAAKWQLLRVSFATGDWWLTVVVLVGSLLAAAYALRLLALAFAQTQRAATTALRPGLRLVPFAVALAAAVGGLFSAPLLSQLGLAAPP